jgi:beta-lactamase regulating signal transducer with metallopeptidase domain
MEYFQYDETYLPAVMFIWGLGVLGMIAYALVSYVNLKRKVSASIKRKDNVYICDEIKSSFIFGVIRPRIYLPSGIEESVENYVIAHEKAHLKRHDYLWKPLGFLLLAVYWFHPILWLAYVLFCRDIEAACDEKVIEDLDKERKADYSAALLICAMQRRMITVCPLAFGETNVKGRVKSILNYKKPAFRVVAVAIVLCIAAAICLLTNPQSDSNASSVGDEQVDFYLDVNQEDDNDAIDSTSEMLHSENGREYGYPARTYTIGKDTEGVGEDSKE